jgi:hypothetical protein
MRQSIQIWHAIDSIERMTIFFDTAYHMMFPHVRSWLFLSRFMQNAAGIHLPCQRASRQITHQSWITVNTRILTRSLKAYRWSLNRLFNDSLPTSEDDVGRIIMKCGLEKTEGDVFNNFSFRIDTWRKPSKERELMAQRPNKSQRLYGFN